MFMMDWVKMVFMVTLLMVEHLAISAKQGNSISFDLFLARGNSDVQDASTKLAWCVVVFIHGF